MINSLVVLDETLMGIVIVSLQYGGLSRIYVIKFKGYDWLVNFFQSLMYLHIAWLVWIMQARVRRLDWVFLEGLWSICMVIVYFSGWDGEYHQIQCICMKFWVAAILWRFWYRFYIQYFTKRRERQFRRVSWDQRSCSEGPDSFSIWDCHFEWQHDVWMCDRCSMWIKLSSL